MGATLETEKKGEEQFDSRKETSQKPQVPFPNKLKRHKMEKEFGKFLEIFKSLHINIPIVDALAQMPYYAKFLKEILVNKRKLGDVAIVALNEECSAILLNKLPQKLIKKALCDLGASINLMPYSIFKKLGLGEPQPTRVALQLANRSIKHPRGIIEDVLVKVDKFIFPVDFIVLDMEEDIDVPHILGRLFLATGKTMIDVQ
uniref:Uncharacterized protein LOC104590929 n=1 Tax=Nelumbo nucifera TaxID=4432 RepID=A0A1U7ZJM9_NELNU